MMRLFDRRIALDEVKRILPFDPELGCSLADVARGGDALGFPAEVRFVKPTDLATLPFPFVLHSMGSLQKGTGHFRVVVRYSPQRRLWSVVDTTFGGFQEETEEAFLQGFSGYVLVPKNSANRIPQHLVTVALVATGCLLGFLAWATPRTREKNVAPRATSAESPCGS
jgi:ABC-type bacteriocin/lantibiotic exporter with double-glycine peptidase domain